MAAMDAASLAFRPGTFDAALMVFVLFLLPEPIMALAEVRRALRCSVGGHPYPRESTFARAAPASESTD